MDSKMIKQFVSSIDQVVIDYYIKDGQLSYKTEGTEDFQDFILEDKRAYSDEEYAEFLSLFSHYDIVNNPKLYAEMWH
tara:strand:+ start:44 stop:277 length:234 start_codon:yes stop_codon:yes gene_type:complete